MSSVPTLNTLAKWFKPAARAVVVRGTPWKTYSYDPETGALSDEVTRQALCIFAKEFGEGASLTPTLDFLMPFLKAGLDDGPACDPVAWNNRAHFAALAWAARNKVRHSVRWKTGARVRRARKIEALRRVRETARLIQRRAEGRTGIEGRPADRTAKGRRAARREWEAERLEAGLREMFPKIKRVEDGGRRYWEVTGIDTALIEKIRSSLRLVKRRGEYQLTGISKPSVLHMCKYAQLIGESYFLRIAFAFLSRPGSGLTLTVALRALQSAAYRAHLTRRVKPPVRRTRVRRPLYARPRPPSAPLAPPVI